MTARLAQVLVLHGAGLISRGLGALTYVALARAMTPHDFGYLAVVLSLSLGAAGFVATAGADAVFYGGHGHGSGSLRKRLWALTVAVAALSTFLWLGGASTASLAVATVGSAVCFLTGRSCGLLRAPVLGFYVLTPAIRLSGAIVPPGALGGRAVAENLALAVVVGLWVQIAVLLLVQGRDARASVLAGTAPKVGRTFASMTALSLTWLCLSQIDLLALSFFFGPQGVAAYLPTMKSLEALTAIGSFVAVQLPSKFGLHGSKAVALATSRLTLAYGVLAVPMLLLGPWAIPAVFGEDFDFHVGVALLLMVGYAALQGIGPWMQWLIYRGDWATCLRICGAMVLTASLTLPAAATGRLVLVAASIAAAYAVGLLMATRAGIASGRESRGSSLRPR